MTTLIIIIVLFLFLILLGVPVVYTFLVLGIVGLGLLMGWSTAFAAIVQSIKPLISNYSLACIPLFVLLGMFAIRAGVTRDAFEVAHKWLGRLPGGLTVGTTGACAMFSAVTGDPFAAVVAVGKTSTEEMTSRGYDPPLAATTIAAGSILGVLIPPSLLAVIYAMLMKISVGKQLWAGLLPGILTAALYIGMLMIRAKLSPRLAPAAKGIPWKESVRVLPKIWSIVVLFGLVMGGIYAGIFTPTEAAGIGAALVIVLQLARTGGNRWGAFKEALIETGNLTGLIMAILLAVGTLKMFLAASGMDVMIAEAFQALVVPNWALTLLLLVPFLIIGMISDTLSVMMILAPVYAIIMEHTGIDPTLFGVLVIKAVGIGLLTPPYGFNILLMHGMFPEISLWSMFKQGFWFIGLDIIVIVILVFLPEIATWIPSLMAI